MRRSVIIIEGGINTTIVELPDAKFKDISNRMLGLYGTGPEVPESEITEEDVEAYISDGEIIAIRWNESTDQLFSELNIETAEATIINATTNDIRRSAGLPKDTE